MRQLFEGARIKFFKSKFKTIDGIEPMWHCIETLRCDVKLCRAIISRLAANLSATELHRLENGFDNCEPAATLLRAALQLTPIQLSAILSEKLNKLRASCDIVRKMQLQPFLRKKHVSAWCSHRSRQTRAPARVAGRKLRRRMPADKGRGAWVWGCDSAR